MTIDRADPCPTCDDGMIAVQVPGYDGEGDVDFKRCPDCNDKHIHMNETREKLALGWNRVLDLKSCPFCGADPEVKCIGNDRSRKRKINVKCSNKSCRIERTDAALGHDFHWLEGIAEEGWNRRSETVNTNEENS